MNGKARIVLCCSMDQDLLKQLEKIKSYGSMVDEGAEIDLVHVFPTQIYTDGLNSYIYPDSEEREKIASATRTTLQEWKEKVFPHHQKVKLECLFDPSPKRGMVEYLQKVRPDLVVTATRGKHGLQGLFISSFTDYLIKFAPCDVVVLRPS